jgi:hypothetical protein
MYFYSLVILHSDKIRHFFVPVYHKLQIAVLQVAYMNLLKTKRNLLYIRNKSYHAVSTFHHGYKNQSINSVCSKGRYLFRDPYKTLTLNNHHVQFLNIKPCGT